MPDLSQSGDAPVSALGHAEGDFASQVAEMNRQCLRLLADTARSLKQPVPDLVRQLQGPLRMLDRAAFEAAAQCPILLVDLAFRDPAWWRCVLAAPTRRIPAASWLAPYPRHSSTRLALAALVLAWHTVRIDLDAAIVTLGLSAEVSELIRILPLENIAAIAAGQCRHLRPRWEDRPSVWRHLLHSGTGIDSRAEFNLRALLLTSGDWEALGRRTDSADLGARSGLVSTHRSTAAGIAVAALSRRSSGSVQPSTGRSEAKRDR